MPQYTDAPEAQNLAMEVIERYGDSLNDNLLDPEIRIDYIFRDDTPMKNGKATWATANKISGRTAFFAGCRIGTFYCIEISKLVWLGLPQRAREALLFHELKHINPWMNTESVWQFDLRGHDYEGFADEHRLFGLWRESSVRLFESMQLGLDLWSDEPVKGDPSVPREVMQNLDEQARMSEDGQLTLDNVVLPEDIKAHQESEEMVTVSVRGHAPVTVTSAQFSKIANDPEAIRRAVTEGYHDVLAQREADYAASHQRVDELVGATT